MSNAGAVDREVIDIGGETDLPVAVAGTVDVEREVKNFEAMVKLQNALIPATIRVTRPQDWVEMGDKVYLQGTGVERIAALWGLVFGAPEVERVDLPGGEFAYTCRGMVASRRTGVIYRSIEGGRSSDDPFFDTFDEDKPSGFYNMSADEKSAWKRAHRITPNELDVRKAAVTNWQTRAASMVTGMRGLKKADLEKEGIIGVQSVAFGAGTKGGQAKSVNTAGVATVPWGQKQGTPVTDLLDNDLTYYLSKAVAAINDPGKARFRAKEQAWHDAILSEQARRANLDDGPPDETEAGTRG